MKNLTTAIYTRFTGSALSTSVGGRLYKGRAPQGVVWPYVVYFVVSDVPFKTFTEDYEDVLLQFSLFSNTPESTTQVEQMFSDLKTLYDEAILTVTGYTMVWMKRQNAVLIAEEDITTSGTSETWHYAVDYDIRISKN